MSEEKSQHLYRLYLRGLVTFDYFVDVICDDIMDKFYESVGLNSR